MVCLDLTLEVSRQTNNTDIDTMLVKRRAPRRQSIRLPNIHPFLHSPKEHRTISSTINLSTIECDDHEHAQHLEIYKHFERDFYDNRLESEFDRTLGETLQAKNAGETNAMPQKEFIKQISNEVKIKLFQEYVKKVKQRPLGSKKSLKQRQRGLYQKGSRSRRELSTLSVEKLKGQRSREKVGCSGIFSVQETIHQLQQKSRKSADRNPRNSRVYQQLINPILFVNI